MIRFLAVLLSAVLAAGPLHAQSGDEGSASSAMALPDCPQQLAGRDDPSAGPDDPFECYCSREARRVRKAKVFGIGPYDGISTICLAALHAGATGPDGGDVRVIPGPSQESYEGSLANGVFSSDWKHTSQFPSFNVEAAGSP